MKFALVNGQRQEALPDLSGMCPGCDGPLIAKCGERREWHWAHKGRRLCDPWWENETDWHRAWKDQFPTEWQEIVHHSGDGERHIADVKTSRGWVIEFQHSHITPEERRSREAFYPKVIWVVDGTRLKRDMTQLIKSWNEGVPVGGGNSLVRKAFLTDCRLLREWAESNVPIFIDLGESGPLLWVCTRNADGWAYLHPFPRAQFIGAHCGTQPEAASQFDEFVNDLPKLIADYEAHSQAQSVRRYPLQPRGFRRSFRL